MIVLSHCSSLCCRINDRVISANNISLEGVDYATAVQVIKETVSRPTFVYLRSSVSSLFFVCHLWLLLQHWSLCSLFAKFTMNKISTVSYRRHNLSFWYIRGTLLSLRCCINPFLGVSGCTRGGGAASQKSALSLFCYAVETVNVREKCFPSS